MDIKLDMVLIILQHIQILNHYRPETNIYKVVYQLYLHFLQKMCHFKLLAGSLLQLNVSKPSTGIISSNANHTPSQPSTPRSIHT